MGSNLLIARCGRFLEQLLRTHDYARRAITALGGLLVDESLLQRARMFGCSEAFNGTYFSVADLGNRQNAREDGLAVKQYRASAALPKPTPEFGAVQAEIVAQHIEQRRRGIGIDHLSFAVYAQLHRNVPHGQKTESANSFPYPDLRANAVQ